MKRLLFAAILCCGAITSGSAQTRPSNYVQAERSFNALSPPNRIQFQIMLSAEGSWPAIPNLNFSSRLQESIAIFQRKYGFAPDGAIDAPQISKLVEIVRPYFFDWGLENISHPVFGQPIWAPLKLLTHQKTTKYGIEFSAPAGALTLSYDFVPGELNEFYRVMIAPSKHRARLDYQVLRKDFFVIVKSYDSGLKSYMRFHRTSQGSLGFHLLWSSAEPEVRGDQLATLISASFHSRMFFGVSIPIPKLGSPSRGYEVKSEPSVRPTTSTPSTRETQPRLSSGSGFFVSGSGHILTNAHVVDKCGTITVTPEGMSARSATVLAADATNDMALLKTEITPSAVLPIRRETMKLGEPVAAFGFPLTSVLSRNGNFTLGNVTALAGIADDTRYIQISTPVQSGNSGGPLLDQRGNVAGIVTAKLNAVRTAAVTGDVPQNVNFAIKSTHALSFLEANRIEAVPVISDTKSAIDLAEWSRNASVLITCR